MSGSRPPVQGGADQEPVGAAQANADALAWYVASVDVTPPTDLSARVLARVAQEPRRTPPGRLVAALVSLSPRRIARAFRRNLDAAAGRVAAAPVVRAQAIALVVMLVVSVGALGTAGAWVVRTTLDRQPALPSVAAPTPTMRLVITPSPTSSPDLTPPMRTPNLVVPTDGPAIPVGPDVTLPGPTDRRVGPDRTPPERPPRPDHTQKPKPTQKPRPTQEPKRTQKPRPTQKPHPTQKPKPTQKPRPTPRSGQGQAGQAQGADGTPADGWLDRPSAILARNPHGPVPRARRGGPSA